MQKIYSILIALFAGILILAGCRKEEYLVTFSPNGGEGTFLTQTFSQKIAQPLMANSFTKSGYIFAGWNTVPNGSGIAYKEQENVKITGHIVLYAQWVLPSGSFTVSFISNGGEGKMEPQMFEAGVAKSLSANRFYYERYEFKSWNNSPNGSGQSFVNEQNISIASDMVLYAQWVPLYNKVYVIFDPNGGEGTMEPQIFIRYEYKELDTNTFIRENHSFVGWNTKSDGSGYSYKDNQKIEISSNTKLYAQWAKIPEPCTGIPTVTDASGNIYNTVQIGSQCWIRENLKTSKYNNGMSIPVITDPYQWYELANGAMCYYNNFEPNADKFGALYNGFAVLTNLLCPEGWHIPSNDEWIELANRLGGNNIAGYKLKTAADWPEDWYGNANGNNESGFTALPAGTRYTDYYYGYYSGINTSAFFWSSTTSDSGLRVRKLSSDSNSLLQDIQYRNSGNSVRCIKD
jgi:uncharacterized protein (TIGR02145 family)/uncharacterized repeat protein (TIGR02543 family)